MSCSTVTTWSVITPNLLQYYDYIECCNHLFPAVQCTNTGSIKLFVSLHLKAFTLHTEIIITPYFLHCGVHLELYI